MSKKKHPEHVNHERWLVSYADFITLLFAFFVVLFASGQSDKHKQAQLARAMQSAFDNHGIFEAHSNTPPISNEPTEAPGGTPAPLALPLPTALITTQPETAKINLQLQEHAQNEVQVQIQDVIHAAIARRAIGEGAITVHLAPEGIVISLREGGFFASGQAEVRPDAIAVFNALAAALPDQPMRIEGHTDNIPIHTAQFATNWELSTARAASITRLLLAEHTVRPALISAAGYAEFRPTADNSSDEGRAKNRRVDIVLLRATTPPAEPSPQHTAALADPRIHTDLLVVQPVSEAEKKNVARAPKP